MSSRYYIVEMDWKENSINTTWGAEDTIEEAVDIYTKFGGSQKNLAILTPVTWRQELQDITNLPVTLLNKGGSDLAGGSDVQSAE